MSSLASSWSLAISKYTNSPAAGEPAIVTAPLTAVIYKSLAALIASSVTCIAVPNAVFIESLSAKATPFNAQLTPSVSVASDVQ